MTLVLNLHSVVIHGAEANAWQVVPLTSGQPSSTTSCFAHAASHVAGVAGMLSLP